MAAEVSIGDMQIVGNYANIVDTLGLGAFWDEAQSKVSSMISSAITGGGLISLQDVLDYSVLASSGYAASYLKPVSGIQSAFDWLMSQYRIYNNNYSAYPFSQMSTFVGDYKISSYSLKNIVSLIDVRINEMLTSAGTGGITGFAFSSVTIRVSSFGGSSNLISYVSGSVGYGFLCAVPYGITVIYPSGSLSTRPRYSYQLYPGSIILSVSYCSCTLSVRYVYYM